ncbi:antibiotic biosynthesis monooxygenase family protein [Amycolatopsis sp. CA-161197]|uniref:antibiotic biosynthesis monooxygenase family protein n=1 Tax=Amycolatopsis sp. CA-161197 TaxID=3239922 RepID=UPI003D8D87CC
MYVALFWGKVKPEWQNDEYATIGARMFERACAMPGFVALHKLAVPDGRELAIAYFETEEHMRAWYDDPEHRAVEALGHREILDDYTIEILQLTRSYTKATSTFAATAEDHRAADELVDGLRAKA